MARRAGWSLFVGATAGAGIACVAVIVGRPTTSPVLILVGTAGGVAVASAVSRTRAGPLSPLADAAKSAPEVDKIYRDGFDICFQQAAPSKRFVRYVFLARRAGRQLGRLDADFIADEGRLYWRNVYVAEAARRRGLGAALLVSAALTTGCSVLTSSGRTRDGAALCLRARPALKRHGVTLRDDPP